MGIVFDLDQTLVDSLALKPLRDQRSWSVVRERIHEIRPFVGIDILVANIEANKVPYAIVTSSPSTYAKAIVKLLGWNPVTMVCYHDTTNHKPHPAPILKAIDQMKLSPENVFCVGDDWKDIVAAHKAGTLSVAALWGCENISELLEQNPDYTCKNVDELAFLLQGLWKVSTKML